ncbi:MAG: hypothetical protein sL5_02990 [Candidatus Mesenet longicola]|uniref:Uncharacterized protein n=1 Tax=Candidatus Mesenet longicola TaxID=1892558 RepID=A0A8J3HW09_9RICK|nr:MAG: hypothetical protein sGL2_09250 [Candidatus Mesenet longicola]GHM59306.1 MAG: hypothetical protein sL5_02990 [Candidatus Mesenet longicola]
MHYLKRIWQWLKNAISKVLAFFGFSKSKTSTVGNIKKSNSNTKYKQGNEIALSKTKQSINIDKSNSGTICKQESSTVLNKVENGVQNIIDGIDPENIEEFKDFFTSSQNLGWYTSEGILISLFDLLLDSCCHKEKPVILVQGANFNLKPPSLSEEFKEISKLYNKRNILYIRLRPTKTPGKDQRHWIIFYFFRENKQNKLLFVDSLSQGRNSKDIHKILEPFLKEKKRSLHVSTTKIQQDCYSCGLIASEVARMIYLNHVNIETIDGNSVDLGDFLPNSELNQLITSCEKKGKINYRGTEYSLNASDFRAAHNSVALKFGLAGNLLASNSPKQISLHQILNGEKINYNEARKLVKKHGFKKESTALVEKIKEIRMVFIGNADDVEEFSQGIKALSQAHVENIGSNEHYSSKSNTF